MRFLLVVSVAVILMGCRSSKTVYHAKLCKSSDCFVSTNSVRPLDTNNVTEFTIESLVDLGLASNPQIKAAQHRIRALKHRIPQELSLPDPVVNTTTHLAPIETAAGEQAFALGISQKFVDVDRRATKAAMANDDVRAAEADLVRLRQELGEKIRVACFQLLAIRETIRITREDLSSLGQIEEVILRQYEVKQAVSQQDVLNVQVEQSRIENQLSELMQKEKSYSARIARLVHFETGTSLVLVDALYDVAHDDDVDALIAQAQVSRPELAVQLARVRKARRKICLANLQKRPDYTVGLNWVATSTNGISPFANGDDAVLLGIGFNLPLYENRVRAAGCEAKASSLASIAQLESLHDQIAEEVFDTVAKLESTAATLSLLQDDIIPKTDRVLQMAVEDYANGKLDYAQLISNWRALLRHRITEAKIRSHRMQLMATLTRQIGN